MVLELAQEVERLERPVHRVRPGEPDGGEPAQVVGAQLELLLVGGDRHRLADEIHGGVLAQLAGGAAVDADDLGVLGELARAVDAGELERAGRDQHGVEVHEGQRRRRAADGVVDDAPS